MSNADFDLKYNEKLRNTWTTLESQGNIDWGRRL